jgi:uncharacterized protein
MVIDAYVTLGRERETAYRAENLVRDLDRAGVEWAVAAPADREMAVFNRRGNIFIQAESAKFPSRIIPACSVNPWFAEDGIHELERAHEKGARMLVLNPTLQGFMVNDSLAEPLIGKAGELGLPVYVHTGPHLYGSPWQLVDCALKFPGVNFIMGHAGATDFWNDVPSAGKIAGNIFIEGSFARPFIFMYHLDAVGIERGVMGSFAPRNNLGFEWEQYRSYMQEDRYSAVFGDNMARLLGLKGGAA